MTDSELLDQFESCTLPFDQWTHRMHVKVAYSYLAQYPFPQALDRIGKGIRRYNQHNKVVESETSGYNQTTTHALLHLIAATMRAYAKTHPVTDSDSFCEMHPQLMSKHILRLFYSPQRRMHPQAKKQFVEPDLAPLPKILDLE
jgi:outer membrane protein assembly factor BamD (BamD/ComL family)